MATTGRMRRRVTVGTTTGSRLPRSRPPYGRRTARARSSTITPDGCRRSRGARRSRAPGVVLVAAQLPTGHLTPMDLVGPVGEAQGAQARPHCREGEVVADPAAA